MGPEAGPDPKKHTTDRLFTLDKLCGSYGMYVRDLGDRQFLGSHLSVVLDGGVAGRVWVNRPSNFAATWIFGTLAVVSGSSTVHVVHSGVLSAEREAN